MPSPTDSTWPTSATSASVSKPAICCFRIAEISAARISISTLHFPRHLVQARSSGAGVDRHVEMARRLQPGNDDANSQRTSPHRQPQALQPAAQRSVDHARADLDDHAAEQGRIDPDIDRDAGADRAAQLLGQRRLARFVERLRDGDLGGDLAAPLGQIAADRPRSSPAPRTAAGCAPRRRGNRGSGATTRRARPARPSPCPARRATAPGCAAAASGRRCRAASRAIRADRRRPRRARAARRPDRTAPPHNARPGRKRLSLRKPMESGPQSARRRRTVATTRCVGGSRRSSALGAAGPREIRAVPNTDGAPAQPPPSVQGRAQFQVLTEPYRRD